MKSEIRNQKSEVSGQINVPTGRISVIIPNYNREVLIANTIKNLLAQTCPPHEIIVVDDGSTDKSVEVIQSFGEKTWLIQQANQGPGSARNAGLAAATGDFIQFQDSDDLFSLNKFEAQLRKLEATGADMVFSPWAHVLINKQQLTFESCVLQQAMPPAQITLSAWQARGWFTIFQSLMFRRSFLSATGNYRTDMNYGEDMEFFSRLLNADPRVAFAPDCLTLYRVDSSNKLSHDTGAPSARRVVDWARCLERMLALHEENQGKIDVLSRLILLSGVRKHLRYLKIIPGAPSGLIQSLAAENGKLPEVCLATTELWLRLLERVRLLRSGHRWMPGLQAAPATPQQIKLINDLGFEAGLTGK